MTHIQRTSVYFPEDNAGDVGEYRDVGVKVTFVGGPTAVLEVGGLRLMTDPTLSPAGAYESAPGRPLTKTEGPAIDADAVGQGDAVLLSHDQHADNLDPVGRWSRPRR